MMMLSKQHSKGITTFNLLALSRKTIFNTMNCTLKQTIKRKVEKL